MNSQGGSIMSQSAAQQIREAIESADEVFMETSRKGDAAGLAALYTEEGQLMPPNAGFQTGGQAIQAFWQAVLDAGIKEARLEIREVEAHGDTAIEVGEYTLHGEGGAELDAGKYIVIWKRKDGRWKLHRDIFNSSLPAPG
jgi:uncharacterized protein (TIGR02246 family)